MGTGRDPNGIDAPAATGNAPPPFVSIIIPTYRRAAALPACLNALAQLHYPRDRFEVIVVDDGGGASTAAVVAPFRDRLDLTRLEQPHAGAAAARNRGASHARGEIVAFTDDDCRPAADWLAAIAARLAPDRTQGIAGHTVNALHGNPYAAANQALVDVLREHALAHPAQPPCFPACNLALPAEGFHRIGGFRTEFALTAEDRDLCARWRAGGGRWTYAPEAVVYHAHDLTLRSFWRQQFTHGRSACRFYRTHANGRTGADSPSRPDPALYLAMLRYPFTAAAGPHVARLAALLALSQIAAASGFMRAWLGR
jgi:GT2 family glycosyltransferase